MEQNKKIFEDIKKVIANNDVYETSDEITKMYRIGENKAIVIVTFDGFKNVVSAVCKIGDIFKTFMALVPDESEIAIGLSEACSAKAIKINVKDTVKRKVR